MRLDKLKMNILAPAASGPRANRLPAWMARYGTGAGFVVATFMLRSALTTLLEEPLPMVFFLPAVLLSAYYGGAGPGLFALALSFLAPASFGQWGAGHLILLIVYLCTSGIGIALIDDLHRARRRAQRSTKDTEILHRQMLEHRREQEALRESEARFHELADAMPQIVWTARGDGVIEYVNRQWFDYTGLSPEVSYARLGWLAALHPGDAGRVVQRVEQAMEKGEPFQIEARLRCRTGEYRWHLSRAVPVRDKSGRVTRWFATATDIGEQKRTEMALERTREQLAHHARDLESRVVERTARLEESVRSLESLLYHVAHDLRAPLRAMEGFTQLLLETQSARMDAAGKDYAWRVVAAANRMDQLIKDLLAFGRLAQMEMPCRKLDLEVEVGRALGRLEDEIRGRRARLEVRQPLPPVLANTRVLGQVLDNLLSNALKFVEPGRAPEVFVGSERRDAMVRLWVRDNGIGIDEAHLDKIFQIFGRLHGTENYPGTGIGLAIVRQGIERMGGTVGVRSAPGQGSCFWFELPAAPSAVP